MMERGPAFSAATLHEAAGQLGALPSAIGPVAAGMQVCGPALTVDCPPYDNLWLHRALYEDAAPGAVLVASVGDGFEAGYWGEILAQAALARGVAGLVINGCVRDADLLAEIGFPVFARGLCIRGTTKAPRTGGLHGDIRIGEVCIRPMDLVTGDADGVVVIPRQRVPEVLAAAQARQQKENEIIQKLKEGARTLDLYGLEPAVRRTT